MASSFYPSQLALHSVSIIVLNKKEKTDSTTIGSTDESNKMFLELSTSKVMFLQVSLSVFDFSHEKRKA